MSKDLQSVREVLREVTDGSLAHYSFQDNDDAVYALIDKATVALTTLDNIIARQESNGWQDIKSIDAEDDMRIIGCSMPKITKAGHAVGSFCIHILTAHEDKWNGWVWVKENGDQFYPTHFKPITLPSIKSIKV